MALTFNVDTSNIVVGSNGIFVGDGLFGGPENNRALSDEDGDGVWSTTLRVPIGLSGTYLYLNSPSNDTDWGTIENLGEARHWYCATRSHHGGIIGGTDFWNRILAPVTEDTVLDTVRFGECVPYECPETPMDHPGLDAWGIACMSLFSYCNSTELRFGDPIVSSASCIPELQPCPPSCPSNYLGDNYCDDKCNSAECQWDGGDCPTPAPTPNVPSVDCTLSVLQACPCTCNVCDCTESPHSKERTPGLGC